VLSQYNDWLVVLSVVVAALAAYTALDLTSRITSSRGWPARAWLGGGAFAMGVGIWSMHFIGMLAFNSPVPLGYDLLTTVLSLLIAVVASGFALYLVSRPAIDWRELVGGGVIMGLAIVSMHYVGMAAIDLDPPLAHDRTLVAASIVVAIAASLAALGIVLRSRTPVAWPRALKAASAVVMGVAISGMHYTAMAAVHIAPDAVCLSGSVTDKFWLAGAVAATTLAVLAVALILSVMDARMAARSARMSASLEEAHETSKAKDEFLAMLGHELRNPLAAITNAVAVLRTADPAAPARGIATDIIDRQASHLRRMVDDLLDAGRAMTGKMALVTQPLDLYGCARNAVAGITASGRAARHHLACSGENVWIDGDVTRLEQIVANLVVNSLNYSPPGSDVHVTVSKAADTAVLEVRDTGTGIDPHELPHVFDLFYQSARRQPHSVASGLGIGLTLVRRLVELHGGTVEAHSRGLGSGLTVRVVLPAVERPQERKAQSEIAPAKLKRTIVLIDDDRDVLESTKLLLLRAGHSVITAADGETGLRYIEDELPDVAIVDIAMPQMDGYQVAERVRAKQLPVFLIALTGYGQAQDKRRAHTVGFNAHLTKPADLEKLDQLLAEAR
jgi:NO-binding membrane sensor protein with MHYT domain/CheY-like chemotaxis protein